MPDTDTPSLPTRFPARKGRATQLALWARCAGWTIPDAARAYGERVDAVQRAGRKLAKLGIDRAPAGLSLPLLLDAPLPVLHCAWTEITSGRALQSRTDAQQRTGAKIRDWEGVLRWRQRPFIWAVPAGWTPSGAAPEPDPSDDRAWTSLPDPDDPDYDAACRYLAKRLRRHLNAERSRAAPPSAARLQPVSDEQYRAAATQLRARIDAARASDSLDSIRESDPARAPACGKGEKSWAGSARSGAGSARSGAGSARPENGSRATGPATRATGPATRATGPGLSEYHRDRADTILQLADDPNRTVAKLLDGPYAPFVADAIDALVAHVEAGRIERVRRWAKIALPQRCRSLAERHGKRRGEQDAQANGHPTFGEFLAWLMGRGVSEPSAYLEAEATAPDLRASFMPWYDADAGTHSTPGRLLQDLRGWRQMAKDGHPLPEPPAPQANPSHAPPPGLSWHDRQAILHWYALVRTRNDLRQAHDLMAWDPEAAAAIEARVDPGLRAELEESSRRAAEAAHDRWLDMAPWRAVQRLEEPQAPDPDFGDQLVKFWQWAADHAQSGRPNANTVDAENEKIWAWDACPWPAAPPSPVELEARQAYGEPFGAYKDRVRQSGQLGRYARHAQRQGVPDDLL